MVHVRANPGTPRRLPAEWPWLGPFVRTCLWCDRPLYTLRESDGYTREYCGGCGRLPAACHCKPAALRARA